MEISGAPSISRERESFGRRVMEIEREREKMREEEDQNFWCKVGEFRALDEIRKGING